MFQYFEHSYKSDNLHVILIDIQKLIFELVSLALLLMTLCGARVNINLFLLN